MHGHDCHGTCIYCSLTLLIYTSETTMDGYSGMVFKVHAVRNAEMLLKALTAIFNVPTGHFKGCVRIENIFISNGQHVENTYSNSSNFLQVYAVLESVQKYALKSEHLVIAFAFPERSYSSTEIKNNAEGILVNDG